MPENIKLLAQYSFTTLEEPLTLENGTTLPVGTRVMLVPQTTAHSVRVPGSMAVAQQGRPCPYGYADFVERIPDRVDRGGGQTDAPGNMGRPKRI